MTSITSKRYTGPSEAACQATIVAAAKRLGWLVHAEPPSRRPSGAYSTLTQGHNGWPDLVLIKNGRLLVIELKRRGNHTTVEQDVWLEAFRQCGVVARVVYVPEGQQALLDEITA